MVVYMNIKDHLVIGSSNLLIHHVQGEWTAKNVKILSYLHCVKDLYMKFTEIEFKHIPRIHNVFANALATLSSMIQLPDKNYIDPIKIEIQDHHVYYFYVDKESDGKPWHYDVKTFPETREYPDNATNGQKQKEEAKGKFVPNWQGPYMVHRVLSGGASILAEMDGRVSTNPTYSNAIMRYYI
ncbi:uncharacterized protein LOC142175231 [Nicotiana tabacum]|uniref:Uncharacterized protein LOC142175231 n=1 Tax=Nicotiana tabacum TaxID=4097 RepID=A0AC58TL04_TOBAC